MFLTELFESQQPKHASFCCGRMNPPTVGHAEVINTVSKTAQAGDYYIFVSQTQDSKKNPLSYIQKIQFLRALFPNQASHIVENASLRTIIDVAKWLNQKGYTSVTFVAGSDRLEDFKKLLTQYNGQDYKFTNIDFVSSGDRDPDADGIEGISASAARSAATKGDLEGFAFATGAGGELLNKLYDAVRQGLLVEHIDEFKDCVVPTHEAAGVGVVAKNKKMAKDPRYSMSMTVDVHPDTPTKNAKAFGLIGRKSPGG